MSIKRRVKYFDTEKVSHKGNRSTRGSSSEGQKVLNRAAINNIKIHKMKHVEGMYVNRFGLVPR